MTNEEKATEIRAKLIEEFGDGSPIGLGYACGVDMEALISKALASAEKKGNELHPKERDTIFALGLQQGWNEAITAAVRVALSHSAVGGGCPLSDESVRSYNEAVSQIATKIEALRKG